MVMVLYNAGWGWGVLVTGWFPVAVRPELPIKGGDFLMGNDITGGKLTPVLEVFDSPAHIAHAAGKSGDARCVITRAQAACQKSNRHRRMCYGLITLSSPCLQEKVPRKLCCQPPG